MGLKLVTALETEPVSLGEIKEQCRSDPDESAQDSLFYAYAQAARQWIEEECLLSVGEQTFDLVLDAFPPLDGEIKLPRRPLITVESVQYYDSDGTLQTWGSSNYDVDATGVLARLKPDPDSSYPSTKERLGAVTIRFTAGYSANSPSETDPLPEPVRQALLLKVQAMYDGIDLDSTIHSLLGPYRAWGY